MHPLVAELQAVADPEAAAQLSRYFQVRPGGYGEGDVFWGVKLGTIRDLVKAYGRTAFVAAEWLPLLRSPIHEHRLAALVVMTERARRGPQDEQSAIYRSYLAHTAYVNNWDLVDVSAGPIVGGYLLKRDRAPLYRLARSKLIWDRRIAMVSTQRFIRAGQSAEVYRLAEVLLHDDHELIHKAVGWMLREAGKRVGREELRGFLDRHAAEMPRTTLRYALEHFEAAERADYLGRRTALAR